MALPNPNHPTAIAQSNRCSRRDFFKHMARYAMILGTWAAVDPIPVLTGWGTGKNATGNALAGSPSSSPGNIARYWVAANDTGVNCLTCHGPEDRIQGTRFKHSQPYVKCLLCARQCLIREGQRGECGTRQNIDGQLRSLVYGHPVSVHVDPIEKKPFYHFLPGTQAFSLATVGCPLHCRFCQNWEISQARPEDFSSPYTPPETIVQATTNRGVPVIAFTYNEPTVFTEYLTDIAKMARPKKIRNVLISCGYMNPEPLAEMCQVLDAIKIDLKGFSKSFYKNVCGAELDPVLRSIRQVAQSGVHLEIVNLVVPTLNDSDQMLQGLVDWVLGELGPDVPVHFTRFHPDYKMRNLPPTPLATLEKAYDIARSKGMHYPFIGNWPGHPGNHTYCPKCGRVIIARTGFFVTEIHLQNGRCKFCQEPIAGVWS